MAVPADTPDTVVEVPLEPAVAIDVELLVHVPPDVPSLNVVVAPTHMMAVPVTEAGDVFTATTVVV